MVYKQVIFLYMACFFRKNVIKISKWSKISTAVITLIVLVITIIVLLILAGVSIAILTSENGILNQARRAKEETQVFSEKEAIKLSMINKELTDEEKYNIGEELRDRTLANGDNWKIVYVSSTNTTYGTGWNYIDTGTILENYGETNKAIKWS